MAFRLVPEKTAIRFMRWRVPALIGSILCVLASLGSVAWPGPNFGIDFQGGLLIEVRTPGPADLASMRSRLNQLGLGEVALQTFGADTDVLIRLPRQPGEEAEQQAAVALVQGALTELIGDDVSYRRTESVGPKVSQELLRDGVMATVLAIIAIVVYVWFRFEWQYALGSVITLVHDAATTVGLLVLLQMEINLTTVAAMLAIVGYSLNDTIVIYDRIRENLRRYKAMPIDELIDRSLNETLARTLMTSITSLLALFALYFFGGEVLKGFVLAMIWGVLVGTYSSIYISAPILHYFNLRPVGAKAAEATMTAGKTADSRG